MSSPPRWPSPTERQALEALAAHPYDAKHSNYNHRERGLIHWRNADQLLAWGWAVWLANDRLALTRAGAAACDQHGIEVRRWAYTVIPTHNAYTVTVIHQAPAG